MSDLYSQIIAYDMRYEMYQEQQGGGQYQSSANSAGHRSGGSHGRVTVAAVAVVAIHHVRNPTTTPDPSSKGDRTPSRSARSARPAMKLHLAGSTTMKMMTSRTAKPQELPPRAMVSTPTGMLTVELLITSPASLRR